MPTTRDLHDSETGELIGPATAGQIEASDESGPEGHILIDPTGAVRHYSEPGTFRRVYVSAAE